MVKWRTRHGVGMHVVLSKFVSLNSETSREKKSQSLFKRLIFVVVLSLYVCMFVLSLLSLVVVVFSVLILDYKSVVQLKWFDNIFSDLDDAPNVPSFRSCHSAVYYLLFFSVSSSWTRERGEISSSSHPCCLSCHSLHHWFLVEWQARVTRGSKLSPVVLFNSLWQLRVVVVFSLSLFLLLFSKQLIPAEKKMSSLSFSPLSLIHRCCLTRFVNRTSKEIVLTSWASENLPTKRYQKQEENNWEKIFIVKTHCCSSR